MKSKYQCEKCGTVFDTLSEAYDCEESHVARYNFEEIVPLQYPVRSPYPTRIQIMVGSKYNNVEPAVLDYELKAINPSGATERNKEVLEERQAYKEKLDAEKAEKAEKAAREALEKSMDESLEAAGDE